MDKTNAKPIGPFTGKASPLPSAMLLVGVSSPVQIPLPTLAEIFLLNGIAGLVLGIWYRPVELVAATGVHFWTDGVWHVLWPALGLR